MMRMPKALALTVFMALGCGTSRESARAEAVSHTCDRFQQCGKIGSGNLYESRSDCEAKWSASWTDVWPASSCDDRINADGLTHCLDMIDQTGCSFSLDLLTTFDKCSRDHVCIGR